MTRPHVFDLVPHVGVGPLRLGMTVAEADAAVGALTGAGVRKAHQATHYFFDFALQFELGESGRIRFIGLSAHPTVRCHYRGVDVFDTPAPELFAVIAAHESGSHPYRDSEYLFPDQIVTLYEADTQYDRRGNESRPVWAQVGVGNVEYLAAIRAIRGEAKAE